jgi:hypothetical protein
MKERAQNTTSAASSAAITQRSRTDSKYFSQDDEFFAHVVRGSPQGSMARAPRRSESGSENMYTEAEQTLEGASGGDSEEPSPRGGTGSLSRDSSGRFHSPIQSPRGLVGGEIVQWQMIPRWGLAT